MTGFGPFPGVSVNMTATLVERLSTAHSKRDPYDLQTAVLPVNWKDTICLLDGLYATHQPDVALHFGVSQRARGFEIETVARNCNGGMEDASGCYLPHGVLEPDAPQRLRTTLPVSAMIADLKAAGLPVRRSRDAGTYLCNATLFHALRCIGRPNGPQMAGFVHIPTEMRGGLTWPGLVLGARILIDRLVRQRNLVSPTCHSHAVTSFQVPRR